MLLFDEYMLFNYSKAYIKKEYLQAYNYIKILVLFNNIISLFDHSQLSKYRLSLMTDLPFILACNALT